MRFGPVAALLRRGWLLEPTVRRAALHSGGKARQIDVLTKVLAQAIDMLNRHKHSIAFGVVELEVLGGGPVVRPDQPSPGVSAEAVGRVHDQLAWLEW
jgi:hypothetical protein